MNLHWGRWQLAGMVHRRAVDHGTAFDITWKAAADPQSLFPAIRVAVELVRGRKTSGASA